MAIRDTIQAELETHRSAFLALVNSLSDADLQRKSGDPAWTIKELLFHLALSLEYVPREVKAARQGKNLMSMPQFVYDRLNILFTRIGALNQTRQSLSERYESAYQAALICLASVQDDEWQKRTKFFYVEANIEQLFRRQLKHLEEHSTQIRAGLSRSNA